MSETDLKQAAVDAPDVTAKPVTEGNDAQVSGDGDDLDNLLKSYDQTTKPAADTKTTQPEPKAGADNDLKAKLERVDAAARKINAFEFRQDMDKTVKAVRGNLDAEFFDDTFVEAWLDTQARSDPRLANAWADRHANPKQFDKVLDGLSRNFSKKYGKLPDKAATEDREAVTAAVRGASTKAPESRPPDFTGLSDVQFQQEKEKLFG